MGRINLYNYRYQELYYKKLRVYLLLLLCITLAVFINIFIYSYYQLKIIYQSGRNSYLLSELSILEVKIKPVYEFKREALQLTSRINLLQKIEDRRDGMVAFLQQINKLTPPQIYFNQINWQASQVDFVGITSSPLYLANFLDKLRGRDSIFFAPVLKSNNSSDGITHSFAITVAIKPNLVAQHNEQN